MSSALALVAAFHARSVSSSSIGKEVGGGLVIGVGELGPAVIKEAAVGAGPVEPHISGRLLERRDPDAAVFERLGGERRGALDGDVGARELGD